MTSLQLDVLQQYVGGQLEVFYGRMEISRGEIEKIIVKEVSDGYDIIEVHLRWNAKFNHEIGWTRDENLCWTGSSRTYALYDFGLGRMCLWNLYQDKFMAVFISKSSSLLLDFNDLEKQKGSNASILT